MAEIFGGNEEFVNHLKSQTNKKGWFNVGQQITLLGEHSEKLKDIADYTENESELQKRWANTDSAKRAMQKPVIHQRKSNPIKHSQSTQSVTTKHNTRKTVADKTPASQRASIQNTRNNAKTVAKELYEQIDGISDNSKTRSMLNSKVKNQNVAYVLEEYPDLVNDIDGEWGMDVNDVKKYIINPLNSRLRELGMNKHCLPNDLSKYNPKQLQKACNNIAEIIRNTDKENGYVFKPKKGNEGKVHNPRKTSQMAHVAKAKPKVHQPKTQKNSQNKAVLLPGENAYPEEMKKFILEQRNKGIEYNVKAQGKEYTLTVDYTKTKFVNVLKDNEPVKFSIQTPIVEQLKQKKTSTSKKFSVDVPFNVDNKLAQLQAQGINASMKKDKNGTYSIVQLNNENNPVKSIVYQYDANGDFQYQLNASAKDQSVMIGTINSKTNKMEFKQFKNSEGILQLVPDRISQKRDEMLQDGGKAQIIKGRNLFTIVQTEGSYLSKNGITKIEHKYTPFGVLQQQIYTYKNGRVVEYNNGTKNDAAHNPNPIKISLPKQYQGNDSSPYQMIYGLETKGPKDTAQRFSSALADNKAKLMSSLHLTNEEYDNLAILAMGIAEQETHFGQTAYKDTKGNLHTQSIPLWDRADRKYKANALLWSKEEQAKHSQGITQINYSRAIKEPAVAKAFKAYGIDSYETLSKSPEKQALATMIILKQNKNVAEGKTWQARLRKNNAKIADPNKKLTTNDVIALLWNGAGGVVKRMNSGETITIDTPKREIDGNDVNGAFYAKAVRTYADRFFASPITKKSGSMHTTNTANIPGAYGANPQENGGQLGEVIFMPQSYSNKSVSTNQQTQNAKLYINANTQLSANSKKLLQQYISDGLIGFGTNGLTKAEAMSITENDFKLMSEQINAIKMGKTTANKANTDFEQNYLRSREFTVKNNTINRTEVLNFTRSSSPRNSKIAGDLNFTIPSAFYVGGNAPHSAKYNEFSDQANTNKFAITKSQGVNPYLSNGKVVQDRYRVTAEHAEYTATKLLESGGRCKNGIAIDLEYSMGIDHRKIRGAGGKSLPNAKDLPKFYNAHPEVFKEIRYVNNGDGTSRELNATDVHNLPCGYFGVFTPGKGYENEAGHAFVSDGFGGGFADEHDNGKWAHFNNGKGEHGKLNVYGLSKNVVTVYSEKLGRKVNVPLTINPWYLTPEFRELQTQECKKRGIPVPEYKEEFPI